VSFACLWKVYKFWDCLGYFSYEKRDFEKLSCRLLEQQTSIESLGYGNNDELENCNYGLQVKFDKCII